MKITYVNGRFVNHENAFVHVEDRGYQFADGVYEVIVAKKHILIDWALHCTRLRRSLREIRIDYSFGDDALLAIVKELLDKNSLSDAVIYLQVSRGVARREHGFPKGNITPSVVITACGPLFPAEKDYKHGVAVVTMPDIRWKRRDIKTISLLPNILAKQQATEQNAAEAILIEDDGTITEGSSSNFFIFDNAGVLRTHPENNLILGGITRLGILQLAREAGFKVAEQPFRLADVMASRGAFISSTGRHVLPVTKVNGALIADGTVCAEIKELMKLYKNYIERQINGV